MCFLFATVLSPLLIYNIKIKGLCIVLLEGARKGKAGIRGRRPGILRFRDEA